MSDLTNLQTARSNLISALTTATASPKPNYSINGQSVSWSDYLRSLREEIAAIDALIAEEEGPYEVTTEVCP